MDEECAAPLDELEAEIEDDASLGDAESKAVWPNGGWAFCHNTFTMVLSCAC